MLVIGAGVTGSICATRLCQARCDVTVLARGGRYEAIRDNGIILEDPVTKQRRVTRVWVIDALDTHDRYDSVLVVVRANQVPSLAPDMACNASPNVVLMGNTLSGAATYTATMGSGCVLLGIVFGAGNWVGTLCTCQCGSATSASAFVLNTLPGACSGGAYTV